MIVVSHRQQFNFLTWGGGKFEGIANQPLGGVAVAGNLHLGSRPGIRNRAVPATFTCDLNVLHPALFDT